MDTWENMQRAEQERQYAAQPEQKMQLREDWGNNPYLEQNIRLIKSRAYFTRQSYGQLKINDIYDTAKVSDKEISSVMGIMHCKSRGISNNRRDFLQQLENVRNMEKDDTETPERHEKLYIELNKLIDLDKKALKEECSYNGTYTMHAQRAIELSTNLKKYIVQKNYAQNVLLKTNSYTLAKGSEEYDNVSNVEKSLRNLEQELNLRYFTNEPINRILPAELKAKKDKSIIELQDNKYERTSLDINPNDWENNLSERNKNHLKNRLFLLLRAIQTKYSQHNENFKAIFCSFENYCNLNTSGKNKNNEILRETEFLDLILKELNILKSKSVEIKEMSGLIADYIQLIQTETKGYLKKKDLNFNKTVMNVNILNRYKKKTSFDISKVEMKDYNKRLLFAHEPCLSDIRQGELGDCYLFAGLASIVSRSPQVIKECMVDNGDGTVSVRFYDKSKYNEKVQYQEFYVTVKKEIPEFNNKAIFSQGAFWVHIMEQAYAASGLHTDNLIVDYKNISGGLSHRFIENLLGEEHNGKIKLIDKDINNKELDKNNYINGTINSLKEIVMPADRFKKLEQSHEDLFNNHKLYLMRISDQEFNRYDKILYENLRKLNQLKNKLNFVKSQKDYNNLESEKEQLEKKIKQIEAIEVSRTIEQQNAVNEINTNRNEQKYKLLYNLLIKEISSIKDKNVEGLPSDKQSNMERLFDCLEIAYQKSKERIIMYSEGIVEDQNDILIQMKNTGMDLDEIKTFIKDMIVEYKIKIMNKITQQPDHEQVRSRRNPDRDNIYTSKQVFLYQDIKKALKEGKFVNASTKKLEEKDPLYQESQKIGIVNNHAFTILGAETHFINGQKRRYIRLRDPHAEGGVAYKISPTKNLIEAYKNEEYSNGIFLLDLEHFTKFFDNIYLN